MSTTDNRDEVLSILIGQLLEEQGLARVPDKSERPVIPGYQLPESLVLFHGVRLVFEGRVDDHTGAPQDVLNTIRRYVRDGVAHIAVAVLYPALFRETSAHSLKSELAQSPLRIAVCTEAGEQDWTDTDLKSLGALLEDAFQLFMAYAVFSRAMRSLEP